MHCSCNNVSFWLVKLILQLLFLLLAYMFPCCTNYRRFPSVAEFFAAETVPRMQKSAPFLTERGQLVEKLRFPPSWLEQKRTPDGFLPPYLPFREYIILCTETKKSCCAGFFDRQSTPFPNGKGCFAIKFISRFRQVSYPLPFAQGKNPFPGNPRRAQGAEAPSA